MARKFKYTLTGLIAIVVLCGAIIYAIPHVIDANLLRTQITQAVQDATGRELTINGDISWTFYPRFSLEVDQVALANPANFPDKTPFASIGKLKLSVELWPLIRSKEIIMNDLILDTAKINLTTLSNGQTNWQDLLGKSPSNTTASASAHQAAAKSDSKAPMVNFDIAEFEITNGDLIYNNQQKGENWELAEMNVNSTSLTMDHVFPLTISGKLTNPPSDQVIELSVNTEVDCKPDQQMYILRSVKATANVIDKNNPQGEKIDIKLNELKINSATETFDLNQLIFDGYGTHATGDLEAKNSAHYPQVKGEFKLDQLQLGKLKATEITLPVNGQNGTYNLQPISAKFYGGDFKGNVTAKLSNNAPAWQVSYQLANMQIQSLLDDWLGYDRITGTTAANGQFTASGTQSSDIISSLTGTAQVQLTNGSFEGVDIAYWWQVGNRLLDKNVDLSGLTDTKHTEIANLSGSFTFNNGVGTTNDLQLYNSVIFVRAVGNIDLAKENVNLTLYVSQNNNGQPSGTEIPLIMSGDFGHISVKPDEKTIAVMAAKALTSKTGQAAIAKIQDHAPEALKKPLTNMINKLTGK